MSDTVPVDEVQDWIDQSDISCGDCGGGSFTVLDMSYSSMMDSFDEISPHRAEIECDSCGVVTVHSLKESVIEEIEG